VQSLGLSGSTPRTEGRLKSLFWPSITSDTDVDYLTTQGFWLCVVIGTVSLIVSLSAGSVIVGAVDSFFFFLGGVGVRQRSGVAAVSVFACYFLTGVLLQISQGAGFNVVRILF
jgi:hypothetical protein